MLTSFYHIRNNSTQLSQVNKRLNKSIIIFLKDRVIKEKLCQNAASHAYVEDRCHRRAGSASREFGGRVSALETAGSILCVSIQEEGVDRER